SHAARFYRNRPEPRQPRRRAGGPGSTAVPVRRQFVRPRDRHSRDRARERRHRRHGGISPPGAPGRHGADRDAALHRLQLILRSHPQEPSEQLQLPLFRREPRRVRLLFQSPVSRDFRARQVAGVLEMARVRAPGQPLPAVSAVLGILPVLRGAGGGGGVRIRGGGEIGLPFPAGGAARRGAVGGVSPRPPADFGPRDRAGDGEKRTYGGRAARDYARRAGVNWEKTRFDIVGVILEEEPRIEWIRNAWRKR